MKTYEGESQAKGLRFAIIVSRFNSFITDRLLEGALDALSKHGAAEQNIKIIKVPGAFEIPVATRKIADKKSHDAIICLGAIIRGATPHFDYIASAVSKGITSVSLDAGIPVAFGVITTDTIEQAVERAGTKAGNKGWSAAMSAIEMVNLIEVVDQA